MPTRRFQRQRQRHKKSRRKAKQRGYGRHGHRNDSGNGHNDNVNVNGLHQVNLNLLNSNAGHDAFAIARARQSMQHEILRLRQKLARLWEIHGISESPRLKAQVQGNIDKVQTEMSQLHKNIGNAGYHVSEALHGSSGNTRHYPDWY
jgi:t-SNARE complex subunit (syntaxin)